MRRPSGESESTYASRVLILLVMSIAAIVGTYVVQGAVAAKNVMSLPLQQEVMPFTRALMPQGWAFFTRSAESEILVPYAWRTDRLEAIATDANAAPQYAFGFNRTSRQQQAEIPTLLEGIGKADWTACGTLTRLACAEEAANAVVAVQNALGKPTVCGSVAVAAEVTTPWEWRHLETQLRSPTEIIVLDVECND